MVASQAEELPAHLRVGLALQPGLIALRNELQVFMNARHKRVLDQRRLHEALARHQAGHIEAKRRGFALPDEMEACHVLVLGGTGLLGRSLMKELARRKCYVTVTSSREYDQLHPSVQHIIEALQIKYLKLGFGDLAPKGGSFYDLTTAVKCADIVINLVSDRAGIRWWDGKRRHGDSAWINTKLPSRLAQIAKTAAVPVLQVSSSSVWNGENNSEEGYPANEIGTDNRFMEQSGSAYAKQKCAAEKSLRENQYATVVRFSEMYGTMVCQAEDGQWSWAIENYLTDNNWKHDTWQLQYPTRADDCAFVLAALAQKRVLTGLHRRTYHYGAQQSLTKYEFMESFEKVAGLNLGVMSGSFGDFQNRPPHNCKLSIQEIKKELSSVGDWREPMPLDRQEMKAVWFPHFRDMIERVSKRAVRYTVAPRGVSTMLPDGLPMMPIQVEQGPSFSGLSPSPQHGVFSPLRSTISPSSPPVMEIKSQLITNLKQEIAEKFGGSQTPVLESIPVIPYEAFVHLVDVHKIHALYAGGADKVMNVLFERLSITTYISEQGVPYEIFSFEFFPEDDQNLVLQVVRRRSLVLKQLRVYAADKISTNSFSAAEYKALLGNEPLKKQDFEEIVIKLVGFNDIDQVGLKAVWCDLTKVKRSKEGNAQRELPGNTVEPRMFRKVLTISEELVKALNQDAEVSDFTVGAYSFEGVFEAGVEPARRDAWPNTRCWHRNVYVFNKDRNCIRLGECLQMKAAAELTKPTHAMIQSLEFSESADFQQAWTIFATTLGMLISENGIVHNHEKMWPLCAGHGAYARLRMAITEPQVDNELMELISSPIFVQIGELNEALLPTTLAGHGMSCWGICASNEPGHAKQKEFWGREPHCNGVCAWRILSGTEALVKDKFNMPAIKDLLRGAHMLYCAYATPSKRAIRNLNLLNGRLHLQRAQDLFPEPIRSRNLSLDSEGASDCFLTPHGALTPVSAIDECQDNEVVVSDGVEVPFNNEVSSFSFTNEVAFSNDTLPMEGEAVLSSEKVGFRESALVRSMPASMSPEEDVETRVAVGGALHEVYKNAAHMQADLVQPVMEPPVSKKTEFRGSFEVVGPFTEKETEYGNELCRAGPGSVRDDVAMLESLTRDLQNASNLNTRDVSRRFSQETSDGSCSEESDEDKEELRLRIQANIIREPLVGRHYSDLANVLCEGETIQLNDNLYGQKELFIKAIELDPTDAVPYSNLGVTLSFTPGQTAILNNVEFTEKDLYVKALEVNPRLPNGYRNLADVLEPGEEIELQGMMMDNNILYEKAAEVEKGEASWNQ